MRLARGGKDQLPSPPTRWRRSSARMGNTPSVGPDFDGVTAPARRAVPDTNGAVGATQYFQWVNTDFEIFNKTSGASILGPADARTLWAGLSPCDTTDDDDVVVDYDKMANVWVLEQHVTPSTGPRIINASQFRRPPTRPAPTIDMFFPCRATFRITPKSPFRPMPTIYDQ